MAQFLIVFEQENVRVRSGRPQRNRYILRDIA